MAIYHVGGRTAATAAVVDNVAAAVWNPAVAKRVNIVEVWIAATAAPAAPAGFHFRRITTRGTPAAGATLTAASQNETEDAVAPVSGFLVDLGYTAQPGLAAVPGMGRWVLPAAAGSGIILPIRYPVEVPPGRGFAIVTSAAVAIPAWDVTFVVED